MQRLQLLTSSLGNFSCLVFMEIYWLQYFLVAELEQVHKLEVLINRVVQVFCDDRAGGFAFCVVSSYAVGPFDCAWARKA